MGDLHELGALEQAALVARGEVSVEELTRVALARIDALDGALGAFVHLRPDAAIRTARRLDADRRRDPGAARGPLFGLPTGLKDLHFTRGFFVRMGSRAFRYLWAPFDDITSATVRAAGMVVVGKLSTSELAILPYVETDLHPPTKNPWDRSRTAGGSSGGAASAVGAGMLPIAPGSDGAGSIRIPASFCGLVGHKPTRDLVPNPHARFDTLGISVIGPLARTVDDAAALLDVLLPGRPAAEGFLARARVPPRPLKIRFTIASPVIETDVAIARVVRDVARVLERLGHHVDEGPGVDGTIEDFLPMFQFLVRNTPVPFERVLQPATRWLREAGATVSDVDAMVQRELFKRHATSWFADADVWLTPTVGCPPPPVGHFKELSARETVFAAAPLGAFTAAFNASGQPATNIPVWPAAGGPPVGVQLVGRHGDDALLLALARSLMAEMGSSRGRIAPS